MPELSRDATFHWRFVKVDQRLLAGGADALVPDEAQERVDRGEYLVPELLESGQVRILWVEFQDHRRADSVLEAVGPECLSNSEFSATHGVRNLSVNDGSGEAAACQFRDQRSELLAARVVGDLVGDLKPSQLRIVIFPAVASQPLEERLGGLGQQLATGGQEVPIALDPPEVGIGRNPLRFQSSRVLVLDFGQVFGRVPLPDLEVGVLGQEAEVRDRVDLVAVELVLVQQRLGEDVVHLQRGQLAEKFRSQLQPASEIACTVNTGQQVEERIET